jgi:hypothetical protein
VIASFHIVEYRRRAFSPPKGLAGQVHGLRFWQALNIGGDFAHFREHPGRRGLYPHLRPDFHHWAFYAVWDDENAVDDFLSSSPTGIAWAEEATEACHFWLRPLRVRGEWGGMGMLRDAEPGAQPAGPVAHVIRLDLSTRGALAMWGSAAPNLLYHLPDGDDLLLGLPLVDRPYMQPVSFSVWRTPECAARFARDQAGHRTAVGRVKHAQPDLLTRYSAGSFEPYRCEGTWRGRNPLRREVAGVEYIDLTASATNDDPRSGAGAYAH